MTLWWKTEENIRKEKYKKKILGIQFLQDPETENHAVQISSSIIICPPLQWGEDREMKEEWETRKGWVTRLGWKWSICSLHLTLIPTNGPLNICHSLYSSQESDTSFSIFLFRHLGKTITGGPPAGRYLRMDRWGQTESWKMDGELSLGQLSENYWYNQI